MEFKEPGNLEPRDEDPICDMRGLGSGDGGVDNGEIVSWDSTGTSPGETLVGVVGMGLGSVHPLS